MFIEVGRYAKRTDSRSNKTLPFRVVRPTRFALFTTLQKNRQSKKEKKTIYFYGQTNYRITITHSVRFRVSSRRRATCPRPATRRPRTKHRNGPRPTRRTVLSTRPLRWPPRPRPSPRCPAPTCPPEWPWKSAGFGCCGRTHRTRLLCTWQAVHCWRPAKVFAWYRKNASISS